MTNRQKKWLRYSVYGLLVVLFYVGLVYTYFQFEPFTASQPDASLKDVLWYVFLNPTGVKSQTVV